MRTPKRTWQNLMYLLLLFAAVCVLFWWYSTATSRQIETRTLNYAMDSARQTALRIDGELTNAVRRVHNYAYLLSATPDEWEIGPETLQRLEENSDFNGLRYVDAAGQNLASDGSVLDSRDRGYFKAGLAGQSGDAVIFHSPLADQTVMVFYSPLRRQGEPYGVLLGLYFAEDYLEEMLNTTYFGQPAGVFLCTQEGEVISSSDPTFQGPGSLPDRLQADGVIDAQTAAAVWETFRLNDGEAGFLCAPGSRTDNLCVIHVPNSDYVLVQTFPQSVTRRMIQEANHTGIVLQAVLLVLFAAYVLTLLSRSRKLEGENKEMGYIIHGVSTLFTRFVLADLEADTYQYLAGTQPEQDGFATHGRYETFVDYLCTLLASEQERPRFAALLERERVAEALGRGSTDFQYEYQIRSGEQTEWEHVNVICLERQADRAVRVLILRQNVTALKEKELNAQAKIDLANRKERQYRIAITSNAFCTYEFNLTQDRIEQDITRNVNGQPISLLERAGLTAPCAASECFRRWERFILEESLEEYRAAVDLERLRERFEQGEPDVTVDYWGWVTDGESMCVRQSFLMTRDESTGDLMVMVVAKDITAQVRKQREQTQALQDALLQAQHANHAKTTFLSNMSHDIRTPMNAIIGFTTIALSHIENRSQVQDCLQKVLSSSNHLLSLINDILDMSRIESGKVQIKEQECNLSQLTHNLVNIIQPQVKAKQLNLFIDTFDVGNEDVIADALKLSQIFVNLLSNAVKYTPAGGTISFRIRQQPTFHRGYGDYVFEVADNGIGMSPEFLGHIFEPFEREASTTRTGIQGTGLGMAITKNIVEMMGGEISVRSEKGKGSEFRVALSLRLQDVARDAAQIQELEGLRTLVVDDDCSSCESVSRMLQQIGLRAEWTTSGKEAVYQAKRAYQTGDSYQIYIIDWQMPELSGIETSRQIREAIGEEVPIIILTAYDWTDIEEEARQAGITVFCAKPLFLSDLKAALLAAHNQVEPETGPVWTQADFGGKRILLVEDNELNREIAQSILEETGFTVETAPDGTDAVEMVRRSSERYYDAVLMDIQMPVMDGYEATRTIRAMSRQDVRTMPIIAMTANAMEEDKEAALKNGMDAHIAKPLDIERFLTILRKYLG